MSSRLTRQRKKMVEAVVEDESGLLNLVFFNQPWREKQLAPGTEVALYGKLDVYRGKRQLTNPIVDVLGRAGDAKTGVVVPIYPQSGKADVSTWEIQPVVGAVARLGGRRWPRPLPGRAARRAEDLIDRTCGVPATSTSPTIARRGAGGAAPAALRRVPPDAGGRSWRASARSRPSESGIAHTVDGELRRPLPRPRSRTS